MKSTRILIMAAILFSLCFFLQKGSLFSIVLLINILLTVVVSAVVAYITGNQAELEIEAEGHVQKGNTTYVHIHLKNESKLPIYRLKGRVQCENVLTGEKCTEDFSMSVGPKGSRLESIQLDAPHCGYIKILIVNVESADPLWLFTKKKNIMAEAGVYIMPQIQPMAVDENALHAYNMESYQYSPVKKGNDPSETFGIREYIEGDSPKIIHWKLTGKTGELVVRELGLPVENSILLLLDKRMLPGEILDAKTRASAAELLLSLSHALLEKGMEHSVAWMDYGKGNFFMRHIESMQELWEIAANLMESPYLEDSLSTPVRYLEFGGDRKFASYFYVTAGREPDERRLEDYGAVKVYRAEDFK